MAVEAALDASGAARKRRLQALRAASRHVEWYRKLCQASASHHTSAAMVFQTPEEGQVAAVQREVESKLASFAVELARFAAEIADLRGAVRGILASAAPEVGDNEVSAPSNTGLCEDGAPGSVAGCETGFTDNLGQTASSAAGHAGSVGREPEAVYIGSDAGDKAGAGQDELDEPELGGTRHAGGEKVGKERNSNADNVGAALSPTREELTDALQKALHEVKAHKSLIASLQTKRSSPKQKVLAERSIRRVKKG